MRFALLAVAACSSAAPPPAPPPPPPASPDAAPAPAPDAAPAPPSPDAVPAPVPVACRSDQRAYGTACCDRTQRDERTKFPGMPILSCTGPRIGLPCRAQGDCDIGCSCDDPRRLLRPGDGPQGPADGTRGVVGHCLGTLQIGVWMCRLDETGKVTHMIID